MKTLLTSEEKKILLDKVRLPEHLKLIVLAAPENSETEITDDEACELREYVIDALDLIGFDIKDEPTQEGLILENLVDKFFVP